MRREELLREAETCRAQAEHFKEPERKLLLKIAKAFDQMASRAERRSFTDLTRCW